jgi:hypothetical protein
MALFTVIWGHLFDSILFAYDTQESTVGILD